MSLSLRTVFGGLLLPVLGGTFLIVNFAGDLVRDIGIRGQPMVPADAQVLSADCTRVNLIVSWCTIGYVDHTTVIEQLTKPKNTTKLQFLVFGSVAGQRISLQQPSSHPDVVTSDVGMQYLGNRIATLIVLLGALALIPFAVVKRLRHGVQPSEDGTRTYNDSGNSPNYDDTIDRALQTHKEAQAATPATRVTAPAGPRPAPQGFGRRMPAR
jgi:hypothetical protein